MITKKEWQSVLEVGSRLSSFDWDIPSGYILFGQFGMTVHKLIKGVWHTKHVSNWRQLRLADVKRALKAQTWEKQESV